MKTSIVLFLFSAVFGLHFLSIEDHLNIKIYAFEIQGVLQVSAMPEIKEDSKYAPFKRRLEYLLINVPALHKPEGAALRKKLNALYPDSAGIQKAYLEAYGQDSVLMRYFKSSTAPLENPKFSREISYSEMELMQVASKFFYCDKVMPDTSIQAHICVGLNGIKEAEWENDYTLLEAFCYEGIFTAFDNKDSKLWDEFVSLKRKAAEKYKGGIVSLDGYLEKVKLELFKTMESSPILKQELMNYYKTNKSNLAFEIRH